MDDWIYVVVVIVSGMIGALAGIGGQTLKERWTRPKIKIEIARHNDSFRIIAKNEGNRTAMDFKSSLFFKTDDQVVCQELPRENLDPDCQYIAAFGIGDGIPSGGKVQLRVSCSATDVPEYSKTFEIVTGDDGAILTKEMKTGDLDEFLEGRDIIAVPNPNAMPPSE
jgi:hypothetical protein